MGILDIFKKKEPVKEIPKKVEIFNVLSLFNFDLHNLKQSDFTHLEEEDGVNASGAKFQSWMDSAPSATPFTGFDTIKVTLFEDGKANINLLAIASELDIKPLINLINVIHSNYGKDMVGNGAFEMEREINSLQQMQWLGRYFNKCSPQINLSQRGAMLYMNIATLVLQDWKFE